jgi:phage gp36-like protein
MAAICTQADIQSAIGAAMLLTISDRDGNGSIDTASVTEACAAAGSLSESYIGATYTLSDILVRYNVDIACEFLRIGTNTTTEDSRLAYKRAIEWLVRIQAGEAELPGADPDAAEPGAPEMEAEDHIWGRAIGGGLW